MSQRFPLWMQLTLAAVLFVGALSVVCCIGVSSYAMASWGKSSAVSKYEEEVEKRVAELKQVAAKLPADGEPAAGGSLTETITMADVVAYDVESDHPLQNTNAICLSEASLRALAAGEEVAYSEEFDRNYFAGIARGKHNKYVASSLVNDATKLIAGDAPNATTTARYYEATLDSVAKAKYVVVIRRKSIDPPSTSSFTPGEMFPGSVSGEAYVYELATAEYLGGGPFSAASSEQVDFSFEATKDTADFVGGLRGEAAMHQDFIRNARAAITSAVNSGR